MSKILTRSIFYFGTKITRENRGFDFKEGAGPEINALLKIGSYTLTGMAQEIQRCLNEAGSLTYVVTVDRLTRVITITSSGDFDLLIGSGAQTLTACWLVIGFTQGVDLTGDDEYSGLVGAGNEYQTQYPIKNYISEKDHPVREEATFQVTPSGVGQALSFGNGSRMRANITLITNVLGIKNENFYENANGVDDFLTFINYCMDKNNIEFMPDVDNRAVYSKMFLESTPQDRDAFEFILSTLAVDIFESGDLIFRKVLV